MLCCKGSRSQAPGERDSCNCSLIAAFFQMSSVTDKGFCPFNNLVENQKDWKQEKCTAKNKCRHTQRQIGDFALAKEICVSFASETLKVFKANKRFGYGRNKRVGAIDYYFYPTLTLTSSRQQAWLPPVFLFFNPTFLTCWKNQLP